MNLPWIPFATTALIALTLINGQTFAQSEVTVDSVAQQGIEYLKTTAQDQETGSFNEYSPAITALVTTAMLKHEVSVDDEAVAKALAYLKTFVRSDGGIYAEESMYKNYETSLAIVCFVEANKDGRFDTLIENAVNFTRSSQWGGANRPLDESDDRYGGFGYGKHGRPDASNTALTVDALKAYGLAEDSPEMVRIRKFLSRTQNHYSEHNQNSRPIADDDKGGFFYTPSGGGETKVEPNEGGGMRSYGSMTYAGLKSMIYAGVDKDDERVSAAIDWIRRHYNLNHNPGMGDQGLFYYYHMFAKALDAIGEDVLIDDAGGSHDWRNELLQELAKRQTKDGSWVNSGSDRWMEGDPVLVTGYALLALAYCKTEKE